MDLPTPGEWVAEKWSAKESQVVALCGEKRTLICAGVLPADAKVIVQAKGAADAITKLEAEKAELVECVKLLMGRCGPLAPDGRQARQLLAKLEAGQ